MGTVAKNLGHAKPSTTTDIYNAALQSAQQVAAEKIDALFGQNIPDLLVRPVNIRRKKKDNIR